MEIRILGPLEVVDGQGSSAKLGGRKQRIVLAALALRAGATVSADRLVDLVWGDRPPTQPEATLQVYLSNLRKLFSNGAARVVRRAPGYRLELGPWVLDRDRFGALVGRVAGVIEKLTGVRYASTQTWTILRQRLGWTRQRPARRAAERDDAAIEAWVKRDWPRIKRGPVGEAPGSSSRTNPGSPSSRR